MECGECCEEFKSDFGKVWCEKLDVYEGLRWFKASIWNISGEGYYMHKISSVWRRQKIDKEQHRI